MGVRDAYQTFRSLNHNVKLVFLFTFFQSFGRGIWMGSVLSAYIFFLADESYSALGTTTAASGFALTLIIFPAGYFADRYRRDVLLKSAAVFGFIALIIMFYADTILLIMISLIFWGLLQGLARPSLEAIFADSVVTGDRSRIYSIKHSLQQGSMASGPFVNVALFYWLGDDWEISILKSVLFVGLAISMMSLLSMVLFKDEMSMGEASDALQEDIVITNGKIKSTKFIPYLLILSNLIIGMGAGMTIRFFPIFFLEEYNLGPIGVNVILGLTAISTGLASLFTQKRSLKRGRAEMIFIVQITATGCLFLFALAFYPPLLLLVPLFIARGSLMNAAQPLSRSILMDTVPKHHRGKVNAVEGIAWGLFWNLSAIVGGYLIEMYNYRTTFIITASVYTVGTLPILLLIPLVAKETKSIKTHESKTLTESVLYPSAKEEISVEAK
ncbi:MAG: MFS transporter [Candidatus Kariarchaeaceae archaeon]|jgi:MFS family permease